MPNSPSNSHNPHALFEQGKALHHAGDYATALGRFTQLIKLVPHAPEPYLYAGDCLHQLRHYSEAVALYDQLLAFTPDNGAAHNNRGNALLELGLYRDAIASYRAALRSMPHHVEAYITIGTALQALAAPHEALDAYEQALSMDPTCAEAHWNRSLALLLLGEYQEGWKEYEWRWRKKNFSSPERGFTQPQWDGLPLAGKTILLHGEQGFGDTLQFVRYAPLVMDLGGRVVIECQSEQLRRLLCSVRGVTEVFIMGENLPYFDCHIPLMSLPRIFNTTVTTIPAETPYLSVPAGLVTEWHSRIGFREGLKVGLVWQGRRTHRNDRERSLSLEMLAPLAEVTKVTYFSLQLGELHQRSQAPPTCLPLVDLTSKIRDFCDTAAFISNLDLVITVDTAVAHLTGALGRPVWVLLPQAPDWRWLLERTDSPWYPTARLFRQPQSMDWKGVINNVIGELQGLRQETLDT